MKIIIKVKEEYYDMMPRPRKYERMALKEDIMLHGQQEPIVINRDGFILDGHTRFEICQELGLEVKYRIQDFEDKEEEKRFVLSANVNRRQLTSYQRVELSYQIYLIEKIKAKKRHYRGEDFGKNLGSAGEIVGRSIGLNRNIVTKAVYILEHGDRRLQRKVRSGKLSIDKAYIALKHPNYSRILLARRYIKNNTKIICPKCQQISKKVEWKVA